MILSLFRSLPSKWEIFALGSVKFKFSTAHLSDQTNSKTMMVCNTKCMSCLFFRKPMFKHFILMFHKHAYIYIYIYTPDLFLSKVIRFLSIMAKNASYHISLEFTVGDYAQFQRRNLSKSVSLIHTSYVQML